MAHPNDRPRVDRVILASASPRRRELLEQIAVRPIVVPGDVDEASIRHGDPVRLPLELAQAKAIAVTARVNRRRLAEVVGAGEYEPATDKRFRAADRFRAGGCDLLAADTVVAAAGAILEKPANRDEATGMLQMLSGRTHQVITGIALVKGSIDDSGRWTASAHVPGVTTRYCESHVTFAALSPEEIEACLDSGEWRGVAGGYRIQGFAARHVTALSGSYSNVVGLPLNVVYSILTGKPGS